MILSVHQPQYLPWLGYFDKIAKSDCFVFLDKVQYKHREYQNRNRIRTKEGWIWLTVPVVTKNLREQSIAQVRIDNTETWQKKHLNSITSSYGKAGFFKKFEQFLREIYLVKKWSSLADLNIFIVKYFLKELNIKTPLYFESDLDTTEKSTDRIIQICKKLNADTYLSGSGGKDYLEENKFIEAKINLKYQKYEHPFYSQVFASEKDGFMPYMSIIDLFLNEGDKSRAILGL